MQPAQSPAAGPVEQDRLNRETFESFEEFPTPELLRDANEKYSALCQPLPRDATGKLLPYPTPTTKASIFDVTRVHDVDTFAVEVTVFLSINISYYRSATVRGR